MAIRTKVEMAKFKREKVYRTLVRLKHSLHCDEELNEGLDKVRKDTSAKLLRGILPKAIDTSQYLDG